MTIFSSFIKTPPESPLGRAVPNGGLGGLVQLKGKEKTTRKTEAAARDAEGTGKNSTTGRKSPPPPIQINSVDGFGAALRSAPLRKEAKTSPSATMWKASHPPVEFLGAAAIVTTRNGAHSIHDISSKFSWSNVAGTQPESEARTRSNDVTMPTAVSRMPLSPVELPGSLLLPGQGYGVANHLINSADQGRPRAQSDLPPSTMPTMPLGSASTSFQESATSKSIQQGQEDPKQTKNISQLLPLSTLNSPTQALSPTTPNRPNGNINTLSAEDLIRVLPMIKIKKLVSEWLPAMEKEIGKYKGLLHMYSNRTEVNACHINSICIDLRNVLGQMRKTASAACKQFEKAQADIDDLKRTDLEKLQHTEEELQQSLAACDFNSQDFNSRAPEYQHLKHVLYRVVATLGGCIRNNLAFRLYHSPGGLTEEVVKVLQAYKQWDDHTLRTFPSLVPAELYENAYKESTELKQKMTEYQGLIAEQQSAISQSSKIQDRLETKVQAQTKDLAGYATKLGELERLNASLRQQILALQAERVPKVIITPADEDNVEESKEVTKAPTHRIQQLVERDSIILEQNSVIQDLLRQVEEMAMANKVDEEDHMQDDQEELTARHEDGAKTPDGTETQESDDTSGNQPIPDAAAAGTIPQQPQTAHARQQSENNNDRANVVTPYPRDSLFGLGNMGQSRSEAAFGFPRDLSIAERKQWPGSSSNGSHSITPIQYKVVVPSQPSEPDRDRSQGSNTRWSSIDARLQNK